MILMVQQKIVQSNIESDIREWRVMFMTYNGLHETHATAVEACQKADLDPEVAVVPVPVAVAQDGRLEPVTRLF